MNEGAKKAARSHVRKLAAKTKKTPTLAALRAAGFGPPINEVRRVKAAEALRKAEQKFLKAGYAFAEYDGWVKAEMDTSDALFKAVNAERNLHKTAQEMYEAKRKLDAMKGKTR